MFQVFATRGITVQLLPLLLDAMSTSNVIVINDNLPISRFHVQTEPVILGRSRFYSVEVCYQACRLAQHRLFEHARELPRIGYIRKYPYQARDWVSQRLAEHSIRCDASFLMNISFFVQRVVWTFLTYDSANNRFQSFARMLIEKYGDDFCVVDTSGSKDFIMTSGLRIEHIPDNFTSADLISTPGNNVYGEAVHCIIAMWHHDKRAVNTTAAILLEQLRFGGVQFMYTKTVLLASDSTLRFFASVQGGDIVYKGGIKFETLADMLQKRYTNFMSYRVVIVCCGTNDAENLYPFFWKEG
jgi:hypothetical protein